MKIHSRLYLFWYRFVLNVWPCIRRSGGRVTSISPDFMDLHVKLPLNWLTRNIVGTIYGGSMYASTDPFYMLMLMHILGDEYVVWDKGCTIHFKRPAKTTLFAHFHITQEMLSPVLEQVKTNGETTFTWKLEYKGKDDSVYVAFEKVLYVATKPFYKEKFRKRTESHRQ